MENLPLLTGFCTYQVVQDFFHQQYTLLVWIFRVIRKVIANKRDPNVRGEIFTLKVALFFLKGMTFQVGRKNQDMNKKIQNNSMSCTLKTEKYKWSCTQVLNKKPCRLCLVQLVLPNEIHLDNMYGTFFCRIVSMTIAVAANETFRISLALAARGKVEILAVSACCCCCCCCCCCSRRVTLSLNLSPYPRFVIKQIQHTKSQCPGKRGPDEIRVHHEQN